MISERRSFGSRSTIVSSLVLALILVFAMFDCAALVRAVRGNPDWITTTDFGVYVRAATAAIQGTNLYDPALYPPTLYDGVPTQDFYSSPPFFAELLAPLVIISPAVARGFWMLASIGCLGVSFIILLRGFNNRLSWKWITLIFAFAFSTGPVRVDLYHGEVNFALLLLLALGLWLRHSDRSQLGGICWGILFVIKPFLGVLVLYLLWKREWRAALTSILTAGLLFILSLGVLWPRSVIIFRSWLLVLSYDDSISFAGRPDNYSMHGLMLRLFSVNPYTLPWMNNYSVVRVLDLLLILLLVAAFIWSVPRHPAQSGLSRKRAAFSLVEPSLILAFSMAYGPVTEGDHLFLLLPMLIGVLSIALAHRFGGHRLGRYWYGAALVWSLLFALRSPPVLLNPGLQMGTGWQRVAGFTILLTGLLGAIVLVASLLTALSLHRSHRHLAGRGDILSEIVLYSL